MEILNKTSSRVADSIYSVSRLSRAALWALSPADETLVGFNVGFGSEGPPQRRLMSTSGCGWREEAGISQADTVRLKVLIGPDFSADAAKLSDGGNRPYLLS